MGSWSTSITDNDTAQDMKSEYKAAFYYYDVETALRKIDEYVRALPLNESDEDECPRPEQLNGLPFAKCKYGKHGVFGTEGSMFYFKKRNAEIIGKNFDRLDEACNRKTVISTTSFTSASTHTSVTQTPT